jgi:hypothetical protein
VFNDGVELIQAQFTLRIIKEKRDLLFTELEPVLIVGLFPVEKKLLY